MTRRLRLAWLQPHPMSRGDVNKKQLQCYTEIELFITSHVYTALLYAQQCIATSSRPSVCYVEVSWSHKLEYFVNNFMAN